MLRRMILWITKNRIHSNYSINLSRDKDEPDAIQYVLLSLFLVKLQDQSRIQGILILLNNHFLPSILKLNHLFYSVRVATTVPTTSSSNGSQ